MHHRDMWLRPLAAGVVASTVLVACGGGDSDPKLGDVAPTFEQDANEIFAELAEDEGSDPPSVNLTMDGSEDLNCADGKGLRQFEGLFPLREAADVDTMLDTVVNRIVGEFGNRGYEFEDLPPSDSLVRDLAFANEEGTVTFKLTVVGDPAILTMTGSTPCLDL